MAQSITLKRSAIQGRTPTTGNLDLGELAFNTGDGVLYARRAYCTNASYTTASACTAGGGSWFDTVIDVSAAAGILPTINTASTGKLLSNDGTNATWVDDQSIAMAIALGG